MKKKLFKKIQDKIADGAVILLGFVLKPLIPSINKITYKDEEIIDCIRHTSPIYNQEELMMK
jgi:hypothetical protein